jgi:hypothetical protein
MTDKFNINDPPFYGFTVEEYEKNICFHWENKEIFSKKIGDKIIIYIHFDSPIGVKKSLGEIFLIQEGEGRYSDYVFYLSKVDWDSLENKID